MPVTYISNKCRKHLIEIDVESSDFLTVLDSDYLLKNLVLSGNSLDINVVDGSTFKVIMQNNIYVSSLTASYHFTKQKVDRQSLLADELVARPRSAMSWIFVTVYYLGFYAAIEMARMLGIHQMYFEKNMIFLINQNNISSMALKKPGDYIGLFKEIDGSGNVVMEFKRAGNRPHYNCWNNISLALKNSDIASIQNPERNKNLRLFKDLVDGSNKNIHSPNEIRNHWNYAKPDAYSYKSDKVFSLFKKIFSERISNSSWVDLDLLKRSDEVMTVASVAFLSNIMVDSFRENERFFPL